MSDTPESKPKSIKIGAPQTKYDEPGLRLNIGSGGKKLPAEKGWVNIDNEPQFNPDKLMDITKPWDYADDSVDEIFASHILEHLYTPEFFHVIKEMYRVCKNGAKIGIILPHPRHNVFLNDPTHHNAVTPDTLAMFSQDACGKLFEEKGGRLTPFWLLNKVDFKFAGDLQMVLDPNLPEDVQQTDRWKWMEQHYNNVVVEYRFALEAVKPFEDKKRVPEY